MRSRHGRSAAARSSEEGQALILAVFLLTTVLVIMAFVLDFGLSVVEKRRLQTATDAAVLAAAQDVMAGQSTAVAEATACDYFKRNGYKACPTVNIPPASGPHSGDSQYIEVIGTQQAASPFITAMTGTTFSASARSVAGVNPGNVPPFNFIQLDARCTKHALLIQNGGTLQVVGSIYVNSCDVSKEGTKCSHGDAFDVFGGGHLIADHIYVVGGWELDGGNCDANSTVSPTPEVGVPVLPDPFASTPAPAFGPAATCPTGTSGTPLVPALCKITSGNVTLQPGTYYGGISIENTASVTLPAGVFVMAGGGFQVIGNAKLSAPQVLLYNSRDPSHTGGAGAYGDIKLNTTGTITLGPQKLGNYAGLTIFQDRLNTIDLTFSKIGNGINAISGTIYAPNRDATFVLSVGGTANLAVAAGQIKLIDDVYAKFDFQPAGLFGAAIGLAE